MVRTKRLAKDDYPHNKLVREQAKIDAERRAVRKKSWYSELDADARPIMAMMHLTGSKYIKHARARLIFPL